LVESTAKVVLRQCGLPVDEKDDLPGAGCPSAAGSNGSSKFLAESLLLSALGGIGGAALGFAVTTLYAMTQAWPTVVPGWVLAGGIGSTLLIGVVAGLYPPIRAARLAPTEALAPT
jgi:hypothetical protein